MNINFLKTSGYLIVAVGLALTCFQCNPSSSQILELQNGEHLTIIGNNLCSRMMNFGYFETEVQLRYPDSSITIRNMCDGGNTPGFRPHSGREETFAFPGAEEFQNMPGKYIGGVGHLETPDEWLTRLKTDVIIAFFGYTESFGGAEGLDDFKGELSGFIDHTLNQNYNGSNPPKLVLVSPIAFENLSDQFDLPDGQTENQNLAMYTEAMKAVANTKGVPFVDVFTPSKGWFASSSANLTIDGFQLNDAGYAKFSSYLVDQIFGENQNAEPHIDLVKEAVLEKNWMWHNDFKMPNGVHAFGRRYNPFGPDNYPMEFEKIRQMTVIRDQAIWSALKGEKMDLAAADKATRELPAVQTNYAPSNKNGTTEYLYGQEALNSLQVPPGYKIELFASEREFEHLANPVQLSFDNKGRLWVATMPTYPHYRPGDAKPNDKLIILEDTDGDGKADKETVFVDDLHIPAGFEFAPEGVYVSQGTNLILLKDNDGDDQADEKEIILSGFDDHDTHHVISAFCADPSGAFYMGEGVFLRTSVETPYGTVRGTNGGFFRYNPQRRHLERASQVSIPNPWGIAFDHWGQNFFAETSGPRFNWMMPGTIRPLYGVANPKSRDLIEEKHRVRPTSGVEFISSRHFPDEVQGDLLINNNIGFLGTKQHQFMDDGTGYKSAHRQDLVVSSDKNYRPVDLEFAPDGSLYIVDWHNVLIGHMQHNARDPLRDHVHGRIYRITYPSRPLVEPAKIVDATIEELLENLKLPEYRTRYRTRRELRGRDKEDVLSKLGTWVTALDQNDENYEYNLLEALWVTWGVNQINADLLDKVLKAKDYRIRTAAVKVLRYAGHQITNQPELLMEAVKDDHSRVRLEALVAASWLDPAIGLPIVNEAGKKNLDDWMIDTYAAAIAHLNGQTIKEKPEEVNIATNLEGPEKELYIKGRTIYNREGMCATCHQEDGKGLESSGFPPLAGTKWVIENEERLIKLTLKGLMGPIEVLGKAYPGQVPMTPHEGMLKDDEVAAVLTYVRNSFGNQASAIDPVKVKGIRAKIKEKKSFYIAEDLLKEHPHAAQ